MKFYLKPLSVLTLNIEEIEECLPRRAQIKISKKIF